MSTDIVKFEADDGQEVSFTVEDVRTLVCPQAEDRDIALFMAFCQSHKLDPIGTKDAYLVGYKNRVTGKFVANIITSYHVFNKVACSHESYDGIESGVIVATPNGQIQELAGAVCFTEMGYRLLGGWARVYDKRRSHPFCARVALKDYDTGQSQWKSRPAMMIEKVAKCQAWRGAYPELRDMFDSSEMGHKGDGAEPVSPTYQAPSPAPAPVEVEPDVVEMPSEPSGVTQTPDEAIPAASVPGGTQEALKPILATLAAQFANAKGRTVQEVFDALVRSGTMQAMGATDVESLDDDQLSVAVKILRQWVGSVEGVRREPRA